MGALNLVVTVIEKSFDGFIIDQMRIYYFVAIRRFYVSVPDIVRVDDYQRTIAAVIKAACLVYPNLAL